MQGLPYAINILEVEALTLQEALLPHLTSNDCILEEHVRGEGSGKEYLFSEAKELDI